MSHLARHFGALTLAVAAALTSPAARAESGEASDASAARIGELNEAGARAYNNRNYRAAIEKFVEAYAIDHDPNLLFNIARSYEKLGEIDAAIEKYAAFVAAPGADTEGRLKAKASLAELERLRDQERAHAGAGAPPSTQEAGAAAQGETPVSPAARTLPWVTLGAGVIVTGVGVTLYALGVRDHRMLTDTAGYDDASKVYPLTRAEAQSYVDSGNTKKLIGGIGMGLGGALVVTGVVLLVTGKGSAASEAANVTFAPGPNGVYAGYSGRF